MAGNHRIALRSGGGVIFQMATQLPPPADAPLSHQSPMTLHLDELKTAIVRDRNVGTVVFDIHSLPLDPVRKIRWSRSSRDGLTNVIDVYVSRLGLFGLGVDWTEISRTQAEDLLCRVLTCDMGSHEALMPTSTARAYAACFLDQFSPKGRIVTNGPFEHIVLDSTWIAVLGSTIDTGVVCADDDNIGILWFGDQV